MKIFRVLWVLLLCFGATVVHSAGWVEGVSIVGTDFRVWGWGCDRAVPNTPVWIHIWRDDNVFLGAGPASNSREPAVGAACGGSSQHGFYVKIEIPENLLDYKDHAVHIYVVGGPTTPERLSPISSVQFSGIDRSNPPRNPGDVLGRDYQGSYVGHLGIWTGDYVVEMTGEKNPNNPYPALVATNLGMFNTASKPWGAVNAQFPYGLAVKKCFRKACANEWQRETFYAAKAIAMRAEQIRLIGAKYTASWSYTSAREGKDLYTDYWPVRQGVYRCDTLVVDAYGVLAPWNTDADLWPREVLGAPANWYSKIRGVMAGNYLPRGVYESIKVQMKL